MIWDCEKDFGFDLICVPAVTWRMLSLETTNKRPIWLSLEQCQGLFPDACSTLSHCSSFKRVYKEMCLYSTSQVAVPLAAELVQSGAADRMLCGARQPCNGHRKQHQVLGGLSDHPCPPPRFTFYTVTHTHTHTNYIYNLSLFPCSQVCCAQTWPSSKLASDASEQSSLVQSHLCSCYTL